MTEIKNNFVEIPKIKKILQKTPMILSSLNDEDILVFRIILEIAMSTFRWSGEVLES